MQLGTRSNSCSYNAVNGVPSCANPWLLETVARGEWGFDGYITTDCGAASDVFYRHHYTRTPEEAVGAILQAGTDLDCSTQRFTEDLDGCGACKCMVVQLYSSVDPGPSLRPLT